MAARRDDDDLVDALYPAPDDAERHGGAAAEAATPADDTTDELAGLRRVRALMRDYAEATDEEPPARGLDALLAAAAAHAPRPAVAAPGVDPAPGAWARLRAWLGAVPGQLVAHPAWASAAALTLVAGVAGTLMLRGATPSAVRTAAPTEQPAVGSAVAPGSTLAPGAISTEGVPALPPAEPAADPAPAAPGGGAGLALSGGGGDTLAQGKDDRATATRKEEPPAPVTSSAVGPAAGGAKGAAAPPPEKAVPKGQVAAGRDDEDRAGDGAGIEERAEAEQGSPPVRELAADSSAAPPPPPAPVAPAAIGSSGGGGGGGGGATTGGVTTTRPPKKPVATDKPSAPTPAPALTPTELEALLQRTRGAAMRKDCPVARQLAARLRAADPAFYAARVVKDATIKPCL